MQALKCDDKDEKEAITETLIGDPNKDQCDYECQSTGGCNVRYTGPPRGGPTSGSCFPPLFGGSCSGTPPECLDCNKALDCTESTTELTESKNSSEVTNTDGEDSNGPLNGDEVVIGQILFKIDKSFSHKKDTNTNSFLLQELWPIILIRFVTIDVKRAEDVKFNIQVVYI